MTTRPEVLKQFAELNETLKPKKMFIALLPEKIDPMGIDMGLHQAVLVGRTLFRKPAIEPSQRDLIEMLKAVSEGQNPVSKSVGEDDADKLEIELMDVEGVKRIVLNKYEVFIERGMMFDWDEILPKVFEVLEKFNLDREFKLKGGLTNSSFISGVVN